MGRTVEETMWKKESNMEFVSACISKTENAPLGQPSSSLTL